MNAADADKVYIMQKQIENLQGIAATEETDSTEAYAKAVPTGAQKWASLDKVGGKTVVNDGELVSAEVVEVESKGKNLQIVDTFPIPQAVRDMCPGYGWSAGTVCNEIDFGRKKYVQRVGSVDLGTLEWLYDSEKKIFFSAPVLGIYKHNDNSAVPKWLCANYATSSFNAIRDDESIKQNMAMGQGFEYALGANCQCIRDDSYTDATSFKAAMQGVLLYYELETPIEVDLSDVLPDDHYIEVEAGGTVTFKQAETQLTVPSSVTYQVSTKEAIANA